MIKRLIAITTTCIVSVFLLGLMTKDAAAQITEGWFHPGIDIAPIGTDASSRFIYSTHAGFVTYAGPAPASYAEKGWMVQIESDINKDNIPDVKTRYTHLMPNTLMINDFKYSQHTYSPAFFAAYAASNANEGVPYGNGPYVSRNQLLARVGDSGAPGQVHVQYEIVTARYESLWAKNLDFYSQTCRDTPYLEVSACPAYPERPGFFFPINQGEGVKVTGPVFVNPGYLSYAEKTPNVVQTYPAQRMEEQPPIPAPDYYPPPPPLAPTTVPPEPPPIGEGDCATGVCGRICVLGGQVFLQNLCGDRCPYTFNDAQIGPLKPDDPIPGSVDTWCIAPGVFPEGNLQGAYCHERETPGPVICAKFHSGDRGPGCPAFDETVCLDWQ